MQFFKKIVARVQQCFYDLKGFYRMAHAPQHPRQYHIIIIFLRITLTHNSMEELSAMDTPFWKKATH